MFPCKLDYLGILRHSSKTINLITALKATTLQQVFVINMYTQLIVLGHKYVFWRTSLVQSYNRGGSRIFLGGGALVSCSTSTPINHTVFLQNTSCIRKPQVISGGVRTPYTLPLDPPLCNLSPSQRVFSILFPFCLKMFPRLFVTQKKALNRKTCCITLSLVPITFHWDTSWKASLFSSEIRKILWVKYQFKWCRSLLVKRKLANGRKSSGVYWCSKERWIQELYLFENS